MDTIEGNRARFSPEEIDPFAYQKEIPHQLRRDVISRLVAESFDPQATFLNTTDHTFRATEIGIGNGFLAEEYTTYLRDNNVAPVQISGIDLAPDFLDGLKQNGIIDEGLLSLGEHIPFPDNSQDLIVLSEVLEHMRTPIHSLQEIYRVLKPGGSFIGSVPNIGQIWDIVSMLNGGAPHQITRKVYDPEFTHESHFTHNLLNEALQQAGFTSPTFNTNMVRLLQKGDASIPFLSDYLKNKHPRFGDRLIWRAEKPVDNQQASGNAPTMYLIMGAPRTGKSTISQALQQQVSAERLSTTEIRLNQTSGEPRFTADESKNAYREAMSRSAESLQNGQSVVIDATFQSFEARQHITKFMGTYPEGYRIVPIVLTAAPDEVAARVQGSYQKHPDGDVTPGRAATLVTNYPDFPGAIQFDTSTTSPEEALRLITAI